MNKFLVSDIKSTLWDERPNMAPDPRKESLGTKHKHYNKVVNDAIIENKTLAETEFNPEDKDIFNLMKIDVASSKKDVDYILSVLKSKDMLYVSRALNKSKWLVDDQYKHLFNPENLREKFFPQMTTEATIKLLKFIRRHLKNESRAEEFFISETDPKLAAKWLSRCSTHFIEQTIQTHMKHMDNLELKRLCEKSVTIFEAATKSNDYNYGDLMKAATFLLNTHMEKYLDVVERISYYERPTFNSKATHIIMKKVSERVEKNFDLYSTLIHIPTFVKFLKREEIKEFLFKLVKNYSHNNLPSRFYKYIVVKEFISRMPKEEQFDFVKKHFIDCNVFLVEDEKPFVRDTEMYSSLLSKAVCGVNPTYVWYEFAPFDIAFNELKKLLRSETTAKEKSAILKVLLVCTKGDMKNLEIVLCHYSTEHAKDDINHKNEFVTNAFSLTDVLNYNDATWTVLNKILVSMNVYKESVNVEQNCIEIVIIYNLLKDKPVPEIIQKKLTSTLKNYQKKLSKKDGNKVFDYLLNLAKKKIESIEINSQQTLNEAISQLDYLLDVLLDWNKALPDYPFILNKIKDFAKLEKDKEWKSNLAPIYNKNKSWRKFMFEESVILNPTEDVCINAIKHDPELLVRYKDKVETICCNDKISLEKLLSKLRIYWPYTLAEDWSKSYVARLDQLGNHKALIRGICTILPENTLSDIIRKYAPVEAKIDWSNIDELSLSLQRAIAKNMHIARPQPSPEAILLYAKGDYLQYALPSLHAIFYNLNRVESKEQVPKLLNAPVSLQKHGLRQAFLKLDHAEIKQQMTNIWKTNKNSSIRTVVFQLMFELLRKEKDDKKALELWELMEVFISNLSFQEDPKVYDILTRVSDVPCMCVRSKFLVQSYKFLKSLIKNDKKHRDNYQYNIDRLGEYTRDIMELISPEFVVELLTEFINEKFLEYDKYQSEVRSGSGLVTVLSAYLLCAKNEDSQMQRYEELLKPLIKRSLGIWNDITEGKYYIRRHMHSVLQRLSSDLKEYVIPNKMIIPTKMFLKIQDELNDLPVSENYLTLTLWKLTIKLSELIEKSNEKDDWEKICSEIGSKFGKFCLEYLKDDVKTMSISCIYLLFSKALGSTLEDFPENVQLEILEQMLSDVEIVQAYLATMNMIPKHINDCDNDNAEKIRQLKNRVQKHPSPEIIMHYNTIFVDDE